MILYFTGTGNTQYIANKIAEITKDEMISLNKKIKQNDISPIYTTDRLIFVMPTYAWRIPKLVEEWIDRTSFSGTKEAYFIMNCGDSIGNAGKYIKKLCIRKGFHFKGLAEIIMPENYIAIYDAPQKEEALNIIGKANLVIEKVAGLIFDGKELPDVACNFTGRINSAFVNTVFYPFVVKADKFIVGNQCIGCGKCVKECPLNNIELKDSRPVWGKNCTHCMACICKCPTAAIEYGKNSVGKVRYQCPGM